MLLLVLVFLASVLLPAPVIAQSGARCEPASRVRSVSFAGSPGFDDLTLAASIVTHEAGVMTRVFGIGTEPCLDSLELRRDALRLAVLHRQAGWFQAAVIPELDERNDGVRVRFVIQPGVPALIDSVLVTGLPEGQSGRRPFDAALTALEGRRFDRPAVDSAIVSVLGRLRDAGYGRANRPLLRVSIDSLNAKVALAMDFQVGEQLRIAAIHVNLQPMAGKEARVDSAEVVGLTGIKPGDRYNASRLVTAQQALYASEAFRLVLLDTVPIAGPGSDTLIGLQFSVAEAQTRSARAGVGWATLDCFRTQGRLVNRGFMGVGRRVELSARASKLGVGRPTNVAPALCAPTVRQDPFSAQVNYYLGASLAGSHFFNTSARPNLSVYSERRSEPFAYLRETTIGALFELNQRFSRFWSGTAGFQYENGRTDVDPVISCTRFGQCQPEEIVLNSFGRGIGIASGAAVYDRTNDVINPSYGWRARMEQRAGVTVSERVSTLHFYRSTVEAAGYQRMLRGIVGVRLQASGVFAPGADLVDGTPLLPQQERLFVGGQNSVRGFQQNLLGPVVYVVSQVDTVPLRDGSFGLEAPQHSRYDRAVPRGGTAMLVANLEYRRGFRFLAEQLQFVSFVDAGALWETSSQHFEWSDLRYTPGIGLRIVTPLGPFRMDVGYRPYRLAAGRALYITPSGASGEPLFYCASPRTDPDADYGDVLTCPSTFRPAEGRSFLSRLVFHFGLGQAF